MAVVMTVLQPKEQTDTAKAGRRAMITSSILRVTLSPLWACGAGETINVRQNMTTDTWYKTGNTLYLKYKDENNPYEKSGAADFILTQKIIDLLENSDIYVSANGSDDNDGSVWLPYKTLGAAINRVNELNNVNFDAKDSDSSIARKAFNIYCDGTITQSTNIILNPDHALNLTIKPKSNKLFASNIRKL